MSEYLNGKKVVDGSIFGSHLVPLKDGTYYIGSDSEGLLGVHIAGNFCLKQVDAVTLGLYNSALDAFKIFKVLDLTVDSGGIEYSAANGLFITQLAQAALVAFKAYGSGALVTHAALDPNRWALINGLAVGTTGLGFSDIREGVVAAGFKSEKVTKAHDSNLFDAAALTDSATIWTQPAGTVLMAVIMRLATQFAAAGMTDLDVVIGDAGDNDGLVAATMNLTSDAVGTKYSTRGAYWDTPAEGVFWYAHAAKDWIAYATAVGANLNTTTAGSLEFYFVYWQPAP